MPCRAYQSGNRHQGIQQSSNPAILLHDIPHLNRCCLLICNSDFNFNKFLHQKICQRGFINFIGIQLVQQSLGTSWIGFGFGLGGLNRKQSTCLVSIAHSNVCICMWLPVCCSCCSALLCSRPFVSPSFVQSFNRKLYCLTHIYLRPPALLGHCVLCVLSLPSRVSHKLEHFHDTCKFPAASHPHRLVHSSSHHTHTHTSHLTPYHARIAPTPIGESGIPIRIVCVCVM